MVELATTLELAGTAVGTLGGALLFLELFLLPSYVDYDPDLGGYNLDVAPNVVTEHTWLGRVGALAVAVGFALQFAAVWVN